MTTVRTVWNSSTDLLKRFELTPTAKASWLKAQEELAELHEALFKLSRHRKCVPYQQDAAEELADCLVTLLNVGYTAGLTVEQIEAALETVCAKNDAKSHDTHEVRGGTVKRKAQEVQG